MASVVIVVVAVLVVAGIVVWAAVAAAMTRREFAALSDEDLRAALDEVADEVPYKRDPVVAEARRRGWPV